MKQRTERDALGWLLTLVTLLIVATSASAFAQDDGQTETGSTPFGAGPIVANVGQFSPEVRFALEGGNARLWLTNDAVWLTLDREMAAGDATGRLTRREARDARIASRRGVALRFTWNGPGASVQLEPAGAQETRVSYLLGNDRSAWRRDVPVWSTVTYRALYPGVDLVIGGAAGGSIPWRYEFAPGADATAVALRVEGAESVEVVGGALRLQTAVGEVTLPLPAGMRAASGQALPVGQTAFEVAGTLSSQQVTAPEAGAADLIFSTYLGGALAGDGGAAVAVDGDSNVYIAGNSSASDFPATPGAFDTTLDATDMFVAKLNPAGSELVYATYIGGDGLDFAWGVAVEDGVAYVVGDTDSTDFPSPVPPEGFSDAAVFALNPLGTDIRYATLIGGVSPDYAYGISVENHEAYISGATISDVGPSTFPATGCAGDGDIDAFVAKFGRDGANTWATCVNQNSSDDAYSVVARDGAAYAAGESSSDTEQPQVLLAKFSSTGLATSALWGGSGDDYANTIAMDGAGALYAVGATDSTGLPGASNAFQGGLYDALIIRLDASLTVNYSAYLGTADSDEAYGVAVDTVKALYVSGTTDSSNFPVTPGAFDTAHNGAPGAADAFVARMYLLGSTPTQPTYATYLGGLLGETAAGATTDTGSHVIVTGVTYCDQFPTSASAYDKTLGGESDGFVSKLLVASPPGAPTVTIAKSGTNASLSWGAVSGAAKYQVFYSGRPYFMPGDYSSALPASEPTAPGFTHSNALGSASSYFYLVKAVNSAPAAGASSNRVGAFTYTLVKGQ